jgi:glycosyltransferase involved in cell wall biosynthesis
MACTFTVFTPTFNRAHTLARLHDSLKTQSFPDFEWLIVDDGSTDDTANLVREFQRSSSFPIVYVHQANAGKHVALDRAVDLAHGELFLPVDSDDTLAPNALQRLRELWLEIPADRRQKFSGVTAGCVTPDGRPVGPPLPRAPLDCSALDAVFRWGVRGERFGFHRTEVLRRIRFPVGRELRFVPEGVLWFRIGRQFLTRFVDEPLRVYYTEGADRLTALSAERKGPGFAYYSRDLLANYSDYAAVAPWPFLKAAIHYLRFRHVLPAEVTRGTRLPPLAWVFLCIATVPALLLASASAMVVRR